jgi:Reverse transcriptase (RNA-dependent DNA polymerase)
VVRLLLEAYYEPTFSDRSHGFRPGRGCHTALREVANTWTGTSWFIEGDIADCFGSLDHSILLSIVGAKVRDNRFLRLLGNMLQAGYLEDWTWNATLSGAPQGGVASPVLSNIYLHKLDEFVETVLIPDYTRGRLRVRNPQYRAVARAIARARRHGDRAEVQTLYRRLHGLPSQDPNDPGYRRLRYCRYADDTLLGFVGPKVEAEQIKSRLAAFLRDDLALTLSPDKTLITHARSQRALFLGYEITVATSDRRTRRPTKSDRRNRRSLNGTIVLHGARVGDQDQGRPVPGARQTRVPQLDGQRGRLHHRRTIRGRVSGHRPVLPACRGCLPTTPAALGHGDLHAQNAGH